MAAPSCAGALWLFLLVAFPATPGALFSSPRVARLAPLPCASFPPSQQLFRRPLLARAVSPGTPDAGSPPAVEQSSPKPVAEGEEDPKKKKPNKGPLAEVARLLSKVLLGPRLAFKKLWVQWLRLRPTQRFMLFAVFFFAVEAGVSQYMKLSRAAAGGTSAEAPVIMLFSSFLKLLADKKAAADLGTVMVEPSGVLSFTLGEQLHKTNIVRAPESLIQALMAADVPFAAEVVPPGRRLAARMLGILFNIGYLAFWFMLLRGGMRGGGGSNNPAKKMNAAPTNLSFADVAGVDEAKREVAEVVTMLRTPERYARAGARIPAGVLLVGPPGTGKTLLARCVAAEAGVPFFYCSGSDFVEMFVGRGAARVRTLFEKARKSAPCILFIDELDALGKQRAFKLQRGNDEAEQTLNQLLASMDGLDKAGRGIIVLGATNRYDILDDALTRPGRFDRIVNVPNPDREGRESILKVHTRKLTLHPSVDLSAVAILTPGLSGAELESICNEAAIRAVRRNDVVVYNSDLEDAAAQFFKSRKVSGLGLGLLEQFRKG